MKRVLLVSTLFTTATLFGAEDGAALTKRCVVCHGANFSQAPLGREHHIIHGDKKRIAARIKYYQNPKKHHQMIMKPQVMDLNDTQIKIIAEYIAKHLPKK